MSLSTLAKSVMASEGGEHHAQSINTAATHPLSALAEKPHWENLQQYCATITAKDMEYLLQHIYVPDHSWRGWIHFSRDRSMAVIEPYPKAPHSEYYYLALKPPYHGSAKIAQRIATQSQLHPTKNSLEKGRLPLQGRTICLDPGHLGGRWAKMEERWFRVGGGKPVKEGDMTLKTAHILADQLATLGAKVVFTKDRLEPTTSQRPYQFRREALKELESQHQKVTTQALKHEEELLFYRTAEIRARAYRVNEELHPDCVICLHFDAEDDPGDNAIGFKNCYALALVNKKKLHLLLPGAFAKSELQYEDMRYEMLLKLLSQDAPEEIGLGNAVIHRLVQETGLPPFTYHSRKQAVASPLKNHYLWHRNLLANRLMHPPVIYIEAYVMNNREVYHRIQMGDYRGKRQVGRRQCLSIYREYASAVTHGVVDYFSSH